MVSLNRENRIPPAQERPKCNSILHLFGEWLFEAAHIGSEMWMQTTKSKYCLYFYKPENFDCNFDCLS